MMIMDGSLQFVGGCGCGCGCGGIYCLLVGLFVRVV